MTWEGRERENRVASSLNICAALLAWLAATVGMGTGAAQGQATTPPGYFLVYRAASGSGSGTPDGNLSNPDAWFEPVTGTPYENTPQGGDDASVDIPGLSSATGALNCWGAGLTANGVPLDVTATLSTGAGGLGLSGDAYGPSALTLDTAASTSGGFVTAANVNLNAAVTDGAWWLAGGNTGVNGTTVTSSGLLVSGTLNVNTGASVTTGQVGTLPPSTSGADFYSTTTALQIEASSLYINSGSVACNGDAVIGTIAAQQGSPDIGLVSVSGGGSWTTTGAAHLGVINPNGNYGPPLQGLAGTGTVIVSGSGSLWHAEKDIRAGDDTGGNGFIDIFNGATLQLDAGVNVRLGSAAGGNGYLTFDANGGSSPTLTAGTGSSIIVGDQAFGGLTVQNGASITNNGTIDAGNAQAGNGTITVTGANSSLTNVGNVTVGDAGTGSATISGQATFHAEAGLVVGSQSTSNSTMTITDAGTTSTIDGSLVVGQDGVGGVTVQKGAKLTVNGPSIILGKDANSTGDLTIDGVNSSVSGGATDAGSKLVIGQAGTGALNLTNGANFKMPAFTLGAQEGSSGTVTIDGNSTFQTTGVTGANDDGLDIGGGGKGEVDVTGGGTLITPGSATIVTGAGAGTVSIAGTTSNWVLATLGGNPLVVVSLGTLTMGSGTGQATLNVLNDADVNVGDLTAASSPNSNVIITVNDATFTSQDTSVGNNATASFTGTVTGNGNAGSSTWTVDEFTLDSGKMSVLAGGVLKVSGQDAFIGGYGAVADIANAQLSTLDLDVGHSDGAPTGNGTLTLEQGATASVSSLAVGNAANETGTITIDGSSQPNGTPAKLTCNSVALIGVMGSGTLNIQAGGVFQGSAPVSVGGTGLINCTGTGSLLNLNSGLSEPISTTGHGYLSVADHATVQAGSLDLSSSSTSAPMNSVLGGASVQLGSGGLTVGDTAPGLLTIDTGGQVQVSGPVNIGTKGTYSGTINVNVGTLSTPASQSITLGSNTSSALNFSAGAYVATGSLVINAGATVTGSGSTGSPAMLGAALISVGAGTSSGSSAKLTLSTGATAAAQTLSIGGVGVVDLTGGGEANIGFVPSNPLPGTMIIGPGGTVKDFGAIKGTVDLLGGSLGGGGTINGKTINGGSIVPGDPQTLTIDGDYEQTSDGLLDLEIDGATPGQYDQLDVTGDLELDSGAQLTLDFANGFAPSADDAFDIVSDSNLTSAVSFSQIIVQGLEPGWLYTLEDVNGNEVVESLNNGVAIPEPSGLILGLGMCGALGLRRPRLRRLSDGA